MSRSSVVEAQASPGTFTFAGAHAGTHTAMDVASFAEQTNVPAGGWAVEVTKDVDGLSPILNQMLIVGDAVTSGRVTGAGAT